MDEKRYIVKEGDWLSSIAKKFGIGNWNKIYDHPKNKEFKKKYPDPNILNPGEELWIPEPESIEIEPKRVDSSVKKIEVSGGKKETIEIKFKDEDGKPLANEPYRFKIGGYEKEGKTDSEGKMKEEIDPKYFEFDTYSIKMGRREVMLKAGHLDPVDGAKGIQARLKNLGYYTGKIDGIKGQKTLKAIKAFQKDHELKEDGIAGPKTQDKIKEVYGS